jgi:hypothetical protein
MIYREPPVRVPFVENEFDQMLLDIHASVMNINTRMKSANRYFKLSKHCALEPFVSRRGVPQLRVLPSHNYTPIGNDPRNPENLTGFIKHIKTSGEGLEDWRFHYWTEEEFKILNGKGQVMETELRERDNPDGVNPYGEIPFVYISESDDNRLIPISDDDLISMQFVITSLLTDLTYASKYQAWSIYTLTGPIDDSQKVTLNPNAVLTLPEGSSLNAVKGEIDIDQMIGQVETLVGLLLTTKNLSVGDITGSIKASSEASGVAKMIDRSETTEDRIDQEAVFIDAEKRLWDLWAHKMMPVFMKNDELAREYRGAYSEEFEVTIQFPDQKPHVSDKELIETEVLKLDNKLTTRKRALASINKDLSSEEIEELLVKIEEENPSLKSASQELRDQMSEEDSDNEEDDEPDQDTQNELEPEEEE